jgi:hypothetical protein
MFYQSFGRNNDRNGKPYRLVMVYNTDATIKQCIEFRQSSIHATVAKMFPDINCIECVHLQPSEYNRIKRRYSDILQTL